MSNTAALTHRQRRMIASLNSAAAQADNYGKLAAIAAEMAGMEYEADRLTRTAAEMEAEAESIRDALIGEGVTPEQAETA